MPRREKELEIYGLSGNVTPEGRPMYFNNFGGESSENTIGVIDPRINKNALTHIPSIYDGRILNEKDAIQRVVDANGHDPITGRFIEPGGDPSARSKSLDGKYMGMQGGFNTRREQPQQTRRKIMPYPFNDMQGGMFGPPGGTQNLGGGMGPMTDRDLQMLLGQLSRSQSPTGGAIGGTLPAYDSPAPRGGPAPQGVPGLGTTGIDPSMISGGAGGGLQGMDFNTQAFDDGMGGMQDAITSMGRQKMEEERIRKLLEASMGGGNVPVRPTTAGYLANPGSGHASSAGWSPSTRRGFAP